MTTRSDESQSGAATMAREAGEKVAERARAATAGGGERVRQEVDRRSTMAGERMRSTSTDLRDLGEELRGQGKEGPANLANSIADRMERPAGYLIDADADTILRDAEDFGRQRPWAVMAVGLALGIAAARVLRASSSRRYDTSGGSRDDQSGARQWSGAPASGDARSRGADRLGAGGGAGR